MNISNTQFLQAIFATDTPGVHVTDFTYDPMGIPSDEHLRAWSGRYFKDYPFRQQSNQYFTISLFNADENGKARRRKVLFLKTPVIVLDDVKEKLSMAAVSLMPKPSYILETSPGSEQWGYILDTPCEDRGRVENLLDGLVANGLAPAGKDPGMKGVTRYVRLPEGYNTKKSKMIDGKPFKCRMLEFDPSIKTSMGELAKPFAVNLDAPRREQRVDGAHNVPDHPLLKCGLNIKEVRSDGRFDITCPWVDEHTDASDDGSAIFTNEDGSMGFKCHHGACETRTARDLMNLLEQDSPGFNKNFKDWQFKHVLGDLITPSIPKPPTTLNIPAPPVVTDPKEQALDHLSRQEYGSTEQRALATQFLKLIDTLSEIDRQHYHHKVCDIMGWSKIDFAKIIKDLRQSWYEKKASNFFDKFMYIREHDRFYDKVSKIIYTPAGFQNSFCDKDPDVKNNALMHGLVQKVDKLDFAPKMPRVFETNGVTYGNSWRKEEETLGTEGDCSLWLNHWKQLGWEENQTHMLQWMAYTLLHPEVKINHMLLLGGMEGTGKDFLLKPLLKAMGDYGDVIDGIDLLSNFNEYLLGTKYVHFNETDLGDHKQATEISNKLKPLAAAPPDTLRINDKHVSKFRVRNIVNITMATNSQMPINLTGPSRRFYAVWSDLNVRDADEEMMPSWLKYWDEMWEWMDKKGGVEHCIWYLRNCVDLSDFNPGAAPKMTEFLRNIREASKSPGQQTIEAFIENKIGAFVSDLITPNEACATIKASLFNTEEFTYMPINWFTPNKVSRIMRDMRQCTKLRARGGKEVTVWAVRNKEKYQHMSLADLHAAYTEQMKNIPKSAILR